ncbi:hypothetical protein GQ457_16G025280 [Hibiscus cannabinus]
MGTPRQLLLTECDDTSTKQKRTPENKISLSSQGPFDKWVILRCVDVRLRFKIFFADFLQRGINYLEL